MVKGRKTWTLPLNHDAEGLPPQVTTPDRLQPSPLSLKNLYKMLKCQSLTLSFAANEKSHGKA